MDTNQQSKFQQRLLDQRNRLQQDLRTLEKERVQLIRTPGQLSNVPTHNANSDSEGLDAHLAMENQTRNELEEVASALERISAGNYGVCQECGGEIQLERLEALPFTPRCIDCERIQESSEGQPPFASPP